MAGEGEIAEGEDLDRELAELLDTERFEPSTQFREQALLGDPSVAGVTLFDNFSSGQAWHYEHHAGDARLQVVKTKASRLHCQSGPRAALAAGSG